MNKKQKKWWQYLLSIPAVLILDVVVMMIALFMDGVWVNDAPYGHGMPVITMAAGFVMAVLTVITTIKAIIKAIRSTKNHDETESVAKVMKKPTYIPIIVSIVISAALLFICGKYEIDSFYNNPDHIGFAIPITTFMLAGILLIINLIVIIITRKVNKKRRKNRNSL